MGDFDNVILSEYDGKPIKSKLPKELQEKYKTEKQWLSKGRKVLEDAEPVEIHPTAMNKKVCDYYTMEQTEPLTDEEICATCIIREGKYCVVRGDYVKIDGRCSEWQGCSD